MRKAEVFMHGKKAGVLTEVKKNRKYLFEYDEMYSGPPVSISMPVRRDEYVFEQFPSFFEGLLPEGNNLEFLLRLKNIERDHLLDILLTAGNDMVGAVTINKVEDE